MPLVKCWTCHKEVADTAELCPHCGVDQPEKHFRADPLSWVRCPDCCVKNYPHGGPCRGCGGPLADVSTTYHKDRYSEEIPKGCAVGGAVVCAIASVLYAPHATADIPRWSALISGAPGGAFLGWVVGLIARNVYRAQNGLP